jgi:hypothetical protein
MIRTLRALFLARLLREKIMLAALLAILALAWLSSFVTHVGHFAIRQRNISADLADQAQWLANRQAIEDAARQAAGRLDASRTLDATRLLAEMSAMAHEAGLLNTAGGESQDVGSGQFTIHTLEFNILKADWSSLKAFYIAVQQRSPYIGIEQFSVQADRANSAFLNVSLRVSSVEIVHGAGP